MTRDMLWRILAVSIVLHPLMRAAPADSETPENPVPGEISSRPEISRAAIEAAGRSGMVQWGSLFKESLFFMSIQHGFRLATDKEVRARGGGSFFGGYIDSVANLHGWGDGDPFIVNYVGHPLQGAVAGFIWMKNDPKYRNAEIGRNSRYWKGRLRAMAFAGVYSEAFEIGPISEASIGHVQKSYPQQGFVDHVITPTVGTGWMIAEDAVDRYLIRPIETHTRNRWLRLLARSVLNPSRSFANCMTMEVPWHREDRQGVMRP
jgi:hypothetical protein